MRKFFMLLMVIFSLISCTNIKKQEETQKYIVSELERATGDKFYFLYGLDKEKSFGTEVRYRGILYSDRLENIHWPQGLEIGLTSLDKPNLRAMLINYKGLLSGTKITKICEDKAREIFGEKCNFVNEGGLSDYEYTLVLNNIGKNLQEEKATYLTSVLNIFVDDLDKINITEYRKKIYEFGMFLYEEMNIKTALNIYIRDNKYFEDLNLTYYSIYAPFRNREDIDIMLNKIDKKEKLTDKEKITLIYSFNKGSLDYERCHYKGFMFVSKYPENFPLTLKSAEYQVEKKDEKYIYLNWRNGKIE